MKHRPQTSHSQLLIPNTQHPAPNPQPPTPDPPPLSSVVEWVPSVSQVHLGNVVSFEMSDIQVVEARAAKGAIRRALSLFAFGIVKEDRQFPFGIQNHQPVDHR